MDEDYVPTPKCKSSYSLSSPPSVSLQIPCTSKSLSFCFVCKKPGPKLIVVSSQARFSIFLQDEIILPAGSRCCPGHMYQDNFTSEAVSQVKSTYDHSIINRTSILDLLRKLRYVTLRNEQSRIDFDSDTALSSSDYVNLTGISKENFDELHTYIKEHIRNTPARSTKTSLRIFLFKMKAGISNKVISTIFNISRSSLTRAISSVRQALMQTFVSQNLGLWAYSSRRCYKKSHQTFSSNIVR